jgi:hypothetical protein
VPAGRTGSDKISFHTAYTDSARIAKLIMV